LISVFAGARTGVVSIERFGIAVTSGAFVRTAVAVSVFETEVGETLTGAPFPVATVFGFVDVPASAPRTPKIISLSARTIPLIRTSSINPTKLLFGCGVTGL